jgi:hypothetical protein
MLTRLRFAKVDDFRVDCINEPVDCVVLMSFPKDRTMGRVIYLSLRATRYRLAVELWQVHTVQCLPL